jgi:hypothetical protein
MESSPRKMIVKIFVNVVTSVVGQQPFSALMARSVFETLVAVIVYHS